MDVVGGLLLFAALVAVLWLFIESVSSTRANRAAIGRLERRIQFRRCQLYRSNIGHEGAMQRAADRVDGVAR